MKKTKEEAEITKSMLISSAFEVLSKTSYKAARLEDIAHDVGVTRGAIYWHFENKLNLYKELINIAFENSMKEILNILDGEMQPLKKVEAVMNYLLGEKTYNHQKSAQIYNLLFIEQPEGLEKTLFQVEQLFSKLFEKHTMVLEAGIADGSIKKDINTNFEPRAFYNFLWGYFTTSDRFFKGFDKEMLTDFVQRNFINTIAVNKKSDNGT